MMRLLMVMPTETDATRLVFCLGEHELDLLVFEGAGVVRTVAVWRGWGRGLAMVPASEA